MTGDDQGRAGLLAGHEQVGEQAPLVRVEALLRLVEQQDAGRPAEHHGQVEQLLLSGGQLVGEAFREMADLEGREEPLGPLVGSVTTSPRGVDEDEVVEQGEVSVCRRGTDEGGHGLPHGRVALVGLPAVDGGAALGGVEGSREDPQQGRLAAAVLAAKDDASSRCDGHVERAQQDVAVDRLADSGGHEDRRIHLGVRPAFRSPTGHRSSLRRGSSSHPVLVDRPTPRRHRAPQADEIRPCGGSEPGDNEARRDR